ncbi:arrestin domain-containing protein 3-like [Ostrinia nubilalis]|uniref:arrestin domain-containing protein 3-like n=1 Tax=Ostrinia nubilalis TaxID=29057 RepID=UPI00308229AA
MGFSEGQIMLDSPTGAYYSGQTVNGRVIFELTKVKTIRGIFVKFHGFCSVHWTTQKSRRVNDRTEHYTVSHDSHEEYINLKMYILGSKNAEHKLNPGKYEYPFTFQIPDSCPSAFEGSHGHVRYELKVVADRAYKTDQEIFHPLRVIAPLDLNYQNCKEPRTMEFDQTFCCWCMSSGAAHTLVKLPVTGYCPGQVIPLEVSCSNASSVELDQIKFAIKKDTVFRAVTNPGEKSDHDTVLEITKGPIPGNTERHWTVELQVPEVGVYNLNTCSFIDIRYTLKVSIETSGCHVDEDDSCPIIFGTIPIVGFQDNLPGLVNQLPQVNPAAPYPAPVVNQPVAANNFQGANSAYPGQTYPGASPYPPPNVSPYPSPNPPYPNTNSPYPNPPYPGASPNNAPYPQGNSNGALNPSPYPNPPYPGGAPNPSPNPPYPSEAPNASPYPGANPPYPSGPPNASPYPGANPPYPSGPPNASPNPGANPPYPSGPPNASPNPGANPPYPSGPPNASPYPGANPPYPTTPSKGNLPFPTAGAYPSTPAENPSASSPYTRPMMGGGLRTGTTGFIGAPEPAAIPLLPPGAGVPYPTVS